MTARVVAITGTDTGCGKTVVTAGIAVALRRAAVHTAALKLVATGVAPGQAGDDAELIAAAVRRPPADCVLATYALPRSPLAAASAEGLTVDVRRLQQQVRAAAAEPGVDLLVIEGTGGLLVPLTDALTMRDLLRVLDPEVVIVARAGLGTINHTALAVEAARNAGLRLRGVLLCDTEGTDTAFAAANAARIATQCDVPVLGVLAHLDAPRDIEAVGAAVLRDVDLSWIGRGLDAETEARADVVAADRRHVWHPFTQTVEWRDEEPLVIRSGDGCWVVDADGTRYLDGIASLWANVHGHAHPALDAALHAQAGRIAHSTFLGQTHEPGALLAAELCALLPRGLTRVFYSESGASAVEAALRIALLTHQHRGDAGRTRFVSLAEGYHGDTAAAVSVGRSEPFHRGLDPLLFDVLRVPPPHQVGETESLDRLATLFAEHGARIAALVIEPRIQGAAGMWPHSDAYLRKAEDMVRAAGALVVCDEVATGFGRTGDLFASGGAGVRPDVVALGKGLTGGYLPLSATVVTDPIFDSFTAPYELHRTLYYGHTYSANPLACAVARASLRLFETEGTLERARALGSRLSALLDQVSGLAAVRAVRQRGLMVGIELGDPDGAPFPAQSRAGRRVTLAARRRHVVVRPLGDVVVLNPPLVMRDDEADLLVAVVAESIAEVAAALPHPVPA